MIMLNGGGGVSFLTVYCALASFYGFTVHL
jgi:hypothetical protein